VLLDLIFLACIAVAPGYWTLLAAVLAIQFSANVSHGALQGLIPDLVPEGQRGMASGIKAILELIPLILLGLTIAPLVGAGRFHLAVLVAGAIVLALMLLTLVLVKETPIERPPDVPLGPTMARVLGMLAGIAAGAVAGLVAGGALGGLLGLAVWPIAGQDVARRIGVAVGGVVAMAVAVVVGVWAGALTTIGREARGKPSFTWWMVNRLMFLAGITSIQHFAPFFIMYAFAVSRERAAAMTGTLMMVVGGFTLLSALPGGWLADRLGQRRLIALAGLLAILGTAVLLGSIWAPRLQVVYIAGCILGLAAGLFMTTNWALGTRLVSAEEAGRYLGISNLAGAGAGIIGSGIGGPVADYLNGAAPGLGYFAIFCGYGVLFLLSIVSLRGVRDRQPDVA
jgi:MFS family permease